ncbi:MAG TPA: hypothetical protein VNV66_06225, partial [Pilimelia sp.]|nr:hypothetical protein [Pilimelia sp.]
AAVPFVLLPVLYAGGATWLFVVVAGCVAVLVADVLLLGDRTTGVSVDRIAASPGADAAGPGPAARGPVRAPHAGPGAAG